MSEEYVVDLKQKRRLVNILGNRENFQRPERTQQGSMSSSALKFRNPAVRPDWG
jgi:hypothetical protein